MMTSLMILLLLGASWSGAAATDSPYLKEILMGRCYFAPPLVEVDGVEDVVDSCPSLVGSFMNVLESKLDADIDATDFDVYLEKADFSSPPDKGLFYLRFYGDDETSFAPPSGLVSPEDTPGGKMVKDLVFCGADQRGNCSIEKSNAYWTFWETAYAKFASQMQGHHVQIVVEANADVQFFRRSAIANFPNDGQVSSATLYFVEDGTGASCANSKEIHELAKDLESAGVDNILCKDGLADLYLDGMNSMYKEEPIVPNSAPEKEPEEDDKSEGIVPPIVAKKPGKTGGLFARLLVVVFVVLLTASGLYYYYCGFGTTISKGGYQKSHLLDTLQVLISDLSHAIQKMWTKALKYVEHLTFTGTGANSSDRNIVKNENNVADPENQTEHSPLIITT